MNIENIQPVRNLVLIKLPPETEKLMRETSSGLSVSTLDEVKYHPTHGTVVRNSSPDFHYEDYEVFFSKLHWQTAKDAAFDFEAERDKGMGTETDTLAIKDGEDYYMLIPYDFFYLAKIGDLVEMLNGYVLCEPIKQDISGLEITTDENYIKNTALITIGNEQYPAGTTIITLPHCDIYLEEPLNNPLFTQTSFIIESENIIGTFMDGKIIPGSKQLIIEPIDAETEQENGLTNFAADNQKLQQAKVIAIGPNCVTPCNVGDTIIYVRNTGQRVPPLDGIPVNYEFLADGLDNTKVFGIIKK